MSDPKSGANLRAMQQRQRDVARAEYLRHPDASISDVVKATGVGTRTVARAREQLVKEGLLPAGRNAATGADLATVTHSTPRPPVRPETVRPDFDQPDADAEGEEPQVTDQPAPKQAASEASQPASTKDGEALRKMNEMLDQLIDGEDDEQTLKRMLRNFKRFSADLSLHPDTRMQASTGWMKLRDMARAKDIGPGVPINLTKAIERATDFCRAAGAKVMVPAFYAAFDLGPPPTQE